MSVLFGSARQLLGRPPPAEGAAPRGARARRRGHAACRVTDPALYAFKIHHGGSVGRLALARVLGGKIAEGSDLKTDDGEHVRARRAVQGAGREDPEDRRGRRRRRRRGRQGRRRQGRAVARLGQAAAADRGRLSRRATARSRSSPPTARTTSSCRARCSGCSRRTPALIVEHDEASHEMRLSGVNDEHLNTVLARLKRRYGVEVKSPPAVDRLSRIDPPAGHASTAATRSSRAATASSAT